MDGQKEGRWREIEKAIEEGRCFLLTTHINPDGDGIGSEIGLGRFLKTLGKEVEIGHESPLPKIYRFLDPEGEIKVFDQRAFEGLTYAGDVIFILDISSWQRLGSMRDYVKESPARKVCLDHHPSPGLEGCVNLIDTQVCATGELVYDLICRMGGKMDQKTAEALYVSILTDTGSFRYHNTTPKSHLIAAHLIKQGVDPADVYQRVYENSSWERMRLLGVTLSDLHLEEKGQLAWVKVSQDLLQRYGVAMEELEGFVELPRSLQGVEVVVLFTELPDGKVRTSLRSRGRVDVNQLASRFGGGGHLHAAGILLHDSLDDAIKKVLREARADLRRSEGL